MIDFPARFDELFMLLCREYNLTESDRDSVDVLCTLLACPAGLQPARFIIETDWLSRECSLAWFALGLFVPRALGSLQCQRTREACFTLDTWEIQAKQAGTALMFVEPEYRKPRVWTAVKSGSQFRLSHRLTDCLRLRVNSPRSLGVVEFGAAAQARHAKLSSLARQVLESQFRAESQEIIAQIAPPSGFGFFCELAQKLAREGVDWAWLTNSVLSFVVRRAWLYDRQIDGSDWRLAGVLLRDQVPAWTCGLLNGMLEKQTEDINWPGKVREKWVQAVGAEAAEAGRETIATEISRLFRAGLLERRPAGGGYRVLKGFGVHLRQLLNGQAFCEHTRVIGGLRR